MIKVGFVQVMSTILYPYGLWKFFDEMNVDWRFVYWPKHIASGLEIIQELNLGKSFCYDKRSNRYNDIVCANYDNKGDPIISHGQEDEDAWYYHSHFGKIQKYFDYQEIRAFNEPWAPCSVKERIQYILDWVNGCDFILLDITDCADKTPGDVMNVVDGLRKEVMSKGIKMKILFIDYPLWLQNLHKDEHKCWTDYIENIKNECNVEFIDKEILINYMDQRKVDYKKTLGLEIMRDFYHEKTQEIFSNEIELINSQNDV